MDISMAGHNNWATASSLVLIYDFKLQVFIWYILCLIQLITICSVYLDHDRSALSTCNHNCSHSKLHDVQWKLCMHALSMLYGKVAELDHPNFRVLIWFTAERTESFYLSIGCRASTSHTWPIIQSFLGVCSWTKNRYLSFLCIRSSYFITVAKRSRHTRFGAPSWKFSSSKEPLDYKLIVGNLWENYHKFSKNNKKLY